MSKEKILEATVAQVESLNEKWKPMIEGVDPETGADLGLDLPVIKEGYRKRCTAQLLENTELAFLKENETRGFDNVDPVLINLVRRTAPNMLAYDLVGVQPMKGPTGLIFAMRAHYGAQPQAPFGRPGDARDGFQTGDELDTDGNTTAQAWGVDGKAPNEAFYNEARTAFSGTGTQSANDGTVNYSAYSVGTAYGTQYGEHLGRGLSGDGEFPEMSITIEKTSVEAKTRKLKALYTEEVAQDLKAVHGLDAETELSNVLSTEILAEINREIVNEIRKIAKIAPAEALYENGNIVTDSNDAVVLGTVGLFDIDKNSDGRWSVEKYKSLLMKINKEANAIAKDTRRGRGNFIVCSSDVASMLDLTGKLTYATGVDNNLKADDTCNTYFGMLQGQYKVYIDPYIYYDEVIVGYKGPSSMDAGFFYCPYVPLQMYKIRHPSTFQPAMSFQTRYGKVANPFTTMNRNGNSYFRKFKIANI